MNFSHNMVPSNNKDMDQVGLEKREHYMYLTLIAGCLIVGLINYFFYKYINVSSQNFLVSIFFTAIFPILSGVYSTIFHIHFAETHTPEELLDELKEETKNAKESKVPIILFGLGLFITKLEQKSISSIFPFLLVSLIFGTILIEILNNFIFDFKNLERMIIFEELEYISLMLSYGFLLMSIYLTYKNY
jgi:hypothetical protein